MVSRAAQRLVGRAGELARLAAAIDRVAGPGEGAAIALAAGPGMGKSRLIEEAARAARRRGLKVLRARGSGEWGSAGIARKLLSPGGANSPPDDLAARVDGLYLMTRSGLLLEKRERGEAGVDPDIFTGMLTAVSEFIKDSFVKLGRGVDEVEEIRRGSHAVVAQHHRRLSAAAMVSGSPDQRLREDLRSLLETAWAEYEGAASGRERWVPLSSVGGGMNRLMDRWDGRRAGGAQGPEELSREMERAARDSPVIVCVDDLDPRAEDDVAALAALASLSGRAPLLTLAALRGDPESDDSPLKEAGFEVLALRPLDTEATGALAATTLSSSGPKARASPALRDEIHQSTGGVPLNIIALSRALARSGGVRRRAGAWELDPRGGRGERALRDAVRKGLLSGTLDRLSEEDREILDVASVAGEEFDAVLVSAVIGRDEAHALRAAHRIEREGSALVRAGEGFSFAHPTVRDAVYESMPPKLRREYHRELAAALKSMEARPGAAEESAFHLFRSGAKARAAHELIDLGREAAARGRWAEAKRLLEIGARCIAGAEAEPAEVVEAEIDLARACLEVGDAEECVRLLRRPAGRAGDREPSRALMLSEALVEMRRPHEAIEVVEEALTRAPESAKLALSVSRLEALAAGGESKEVVDVSSAVLAAASLREPGKETSARLLLAIARAMGSPEVGRSDEGEQLARRASDLAELAGAARLAGRAQLALARMELVRGALLEAMESLRAAVDRLDRSADRRSLAEAGSLLLPLEMLLGSMDGAELASRAWSAAGGRDADPWLEVVRWKRGSGGSSPGDATGEGLGGRWRAFLVSLGPARFAAASRLAEEILRAVRSPLDGGGESPAIRIIAPLAALDVSEWAWGLAPGSGPLAEQFETAEAIEKKKGATPSWRRALLLSMETVERLRSGDAASAEEAAMEAVSAAESSGSAMLRGRALRVLAASRLASGDAGPALEAARASSRALRSCGALGEAWVSALVESASLRAAGEGEEAAKVESRVPKERRFLPVTVSGTWGKS